MLFSFFLHFYFFFVDGILSKQIIEVIFFSSSTYVYAIVDFHPHLTLVASRFITRIKLYVMVFYGVCEMYIAWVDCAQYPSFLNIHTKNSIVCGEKRVRFDSIWLGMWELVSYIVLHNSIEGETPNYVFSIGIAVLVGIVVRVSSKWSVVYITQFENSSEYLQIYLLMN